MYGGLPKREILWRQPAQLLDLHAANYGRGWLKLTVPLVETLPVGMPF